MAIKCSATYFLIFFLQLALPLTLSANTISPKNTSQPEKLVIKLISSQIYYETLGIHSDIIPSMNRVFLANFSIGLPPIPQLAVMDTGSALSWVKCSSNPLSWTKMFDPQISYTYDPLPCESHECGLIPNLHRNRNCGSYQSHKGQRQCGFSVNNFVKGESSQGTIARDRFTFPEPSEPRPHRADEILFGCKHDDNGVLYGDPSITGVLGLNYGPISLLSQLDYERFSYCIGKVTDVDSNILLLGGGGDMEGIPTPMKIYDYYSITLLRIDYGGVVIDMDAEVHKYRAILDTGSPFTYIPDLAYKVLSHTVESQLVTLQFKRADDKDDLCFEGKIEGVAIPDVTFSFANGSALVLDEYSLFYSKTPNKFCMAIYPSSNIHSAGFKTLILIGLLAQQNYNVGYDLKNGKLYFNRMDCSLVVWQP